MLFSIHSLSEPLANLEKENRQTDGAHGTRDNVRRVARALYSYKLHAHGLSDTQPATVDTRKS